MKIKKGIKKVNILNFFVDILYYLCYEK